MKKKLNLNFTTLLKKTILPFVLLLILQGCNSYSGNTYSKEGSEMYIKFIDSSVIEWKWDEGFRAEEFEYTIEDNRIRTVRKLFSQTGYLKILENDRLKDRHGNIYVIE